MSQEALHIQFKKLIDLIIGSLPEHETAQINAHLANCAECAQLKKSAENAISVMRSDRLEEVPTHILERTFDLLRERKTIGTADKLSFIRKIKAIFVDQGSSLSPTFGLRSTQPENSKRFWLTAEDSEIDLRMIKTGDDWKISGQVFGDLTDGEVILQSGEKTFHTSLNDLCEFIFEGVSTGKYRIIIKFSQAEIEIPTLNIE